MGDFEELDKLLRLLGVTSHHFDEVAEEFPDLVDLAQDYWDQLVYVHDDLVEEVAEELFVDVGNQFSYGFC